MKRMVVVATMRRGAVEPHEPLPADVEARMFERMYAESASMQPNVHWCSPDAKKMPAKSYAPRAKVDRLMELASKARIA